MKIFKKLECVIVGHKLHSEVMIKDHHGLFTTYQNLITCSNCGKFYHHDSRMVENKQEDHEQDHCK